MVYAVAIQAAFHGQFVERTGDLASVTLQFHARGAEFFAKSYEVKTPLPGDVSRKGEYGRKQQ
jgi:hypothetical protein